MRYALMTEPQQGMSYADQLAIAKRAEMNGFETFFRSDHYANTLGGAADRRRTPGPSLAGLARRPHASGWESLVSPVTFRHPGSFAKVVTTVDEMSGGRIEVGVGAGWNDVEHRQYGSRLPTDRSSGPTSWRTSSAILLGLWGEPDGWSYHGLAPALGSRAPTPYPKPVDVAGRPRTNSGWLAAAHPRWRSGIPRPIGIAARYADEFNLSSSSPERAAAVFVKLDEACRGDRS